MNQNQAEVQAVAAVRPMVSAVTKAYGANLANAQLNFIVSTAFDCLPLVLNDKTFKYSTYMTKLEEELGYALARKTIENSMTVTRKLIDEHQVKMAQYENSDTGIMAFVAWVREQIANTTYTAARDDILSWLKGEPSKMDMRKRAAEQAAEAKRLLAEREAAAAAANAPAPAPAPLADVVQAQEQEQEREAEAKAEAEKLAQEQAAREEQAQQQAKALALASAAEREAKEQALAEVERLKAEGEEARKQAESFAVRVGVKADGTPDIVVALNPSPEFLEAVAKQLAAKAKAIRKQQSTAMAQAMAEAKAA